MFSLLSRLAIACLAIGVALPAVANPRLSPDKTIAPVAGRCESFGNRFARVDQRGVDLALTWIRDRKTPRTLGLAYCYLTADPANPTYIRAAYPIVGSNLWLVLTMDPQGWFKGVSFLVGQ